ncbi:protein plant cadmium resistance 7 [Dunaliella salina]|uniref:Protein plant cadmium resistance 7 n=1 Tax=Dunaliella salina TaxID=3046 RepID=A0ABQ7H749_DUNSA|nr:protein plant cadmium resistance 7 [Dunaliella salina]|eukprot:KAF5842683.1 protein plant cadmium resistance 7 [Dunaliella salina]
MSKEWSSGLFSCFDDCMILLCGCCLPCHLYLLHCCLYFCCTPFACIFAGSTRAMVRNKYGLSEQPCNDCCVHCFCSPCALCQEARQLKVN